MAKSQSDSATHQTTTTVSDSYNTANSYALTLDNVGNNTLSFGDLASNGAKPATNYMDALIPLAIVGLTFAGLAMLRRR